MRESTRRLHQELRLAGAQPAEATELVTLASSLRQLKQPTASIHRSYFRTWLPIGLTSVGGLALGMALVMLAQIAEPGNLLYPIQKASDSIAMRVDPNYRGVVMMKRAQEVKQLVAQHAESRLVLATLSEYQVIAAAYKSGASNYAVFEYCKANLQQAATLASSNERRSIDQTLDSLQNV